MHEIKFPAHTQARMAVAQALKDAKVTKVVDAPQDAPVITTTQVERKPRDLPGHMDTLDSDGRRAILASREHVAIAYGSLKDPILLANNVNLAMLRHYIPKVVDDFYVALPEFAEFNEFDAMILLPSSMTLVTERGVKQVVRSMLKELQRGSYPGKGFTKDENHKDWYMILPHLNVVHNIHALNTLRAFGLDHDAGFLARKDGPVAVGAKLAAKNWAGGPRSLQRYLDTFERELLVGQDKELLAEARTVCEEWRRSQIAGAATKKA